MARTDTSLTATGWFDLLTGSVTITGPRMLAPRSDTAIETELVRGAVGEPWRPANGAVSAEAAFRDAPQPLRDEAFAAVTSHVASARRARLVRAGGFGDALDAVLAPIAPTPAPEPEAPVAEPEPAPSSVAAKRRAKKTGTS